MCVIPSVTTNLQRLPSLLFTAEQHS